MIHDKVRIRKRCQEWCMIKGMNGEDKEKINISRQNVCVLGSGMF